MDVSDLIIPRASWNPQYDNGETPVGKAEKVSLHHSVTTQLSPASTTAMEAAQMRALEKIGHTRFARPGFMNTGISYNVVIFPSGRAWEGVSFNRRGTHTDGMNSTVRSICFAGNYEINAPTEEQLFTARAIVAAGRGDTWTKDAEVIGHRDIKATDCPGKNVYRHRAFIASGHDDVATPVTNPVTPKPTAKRVSVNVNMSLLDLRDAHEKVVTGRAVHVMQFMLVLAGYSIGRAGIDGRAGKDTRAALGRFQVDTKTGTNGKADYLVGEKSWRELLGGPNG